MSGLCSQPVLRALPGAFVVRGHPACGSQLALPSGVFKQRAAWTVEGGNLSFLASSPLPRLGDRLSPPAELSPEARGLLGGEGGPVGTVSSPPTPTLWWRPWPWGFTDRIGVLELLLAVHGPPKLWVSTLP